MTEMDNEQRRGTENMLRPLIAVGVLLIAAATILLLYIAQTVYQVINHPVDVPFIAFIMDNLKMTDRAVFGNANGQSFDIHLSDPVRTGYFLFIGVISIGVVTQVCVALVNAGTTLVKLGGGLWAATGAERRKNTTGE
ncbi:MAG: hypothetical protein GC185_06815 [Alphaproteobacteria bacterium]|nr:hypothetical protein [Alphaproteobacteria bacterium]